MVVGVLVVVAANVYTSC